jgi:hypothetical protein
MMRLSGDAARQPAAVVFQWKTHHQHRRIKSRTHHQTKGEFVTTVSQAVHNPQELSTRHDRHPRRFPLEIILMACRSPG